jgi:ankyrin repeat protein
MDEDRETALIWAVRGRNEAIVQLLLEKGADIEAKNKHGKTVLDIAAEHRYEDIVQLLSKKGGRRGSE